MVSAQTESAIATKENVTDRVSVFDMGLVELGTDVAAKSFIIFVWEYGPNPFFSASSL